MGDGPEGGHALPEVGGGAGVGEVRLGQHHQEGHLPHWGGGRGRMGAKTEAWDRRGLEEN